MIDLNIITQYYLPDIALFIIFIIILITIFINKKIRSHINDNIYDIMLIGLPIIVSLPDRVIIDKFKIIKHHQSVYSIAIIVAIIAVFLLKVRNTESKDGIITDLESELQNNQKMHKDEIRGLWGRHSKKVSDLIQTIRNHKRDIDNLKICINGYYSLINGTISSKLKQVTNQLNYKCDYRVSAYLFSQSQNVFYLIGRYSSNPQYTKPGRFIINDIGEYVFKVICDNSNHYNESPKENGYNIDLRNMKSKDMFGVHIKDGDNTIGVIIHQSMKTSEYSTPKTRDNIIKQSSGISQQIVDMKLDPDKIKSDINLKEIKL